MSTVSNKTKFFRYLALFIAAFIWGTAFVAQSEGLSYVKPFTFMAIRSVLGSVFLIPVFLISDGIKKSKNRLPKMTKRNIKTLFLGGLFCGLAVCAASNLQQFGLLYCSVGKSGFITTMYIVLVPVFGLFLKKKCHWIVWVSVAFAVCGLFFICITEAFTLGIGDLLLIACAIGFTVHIMVIDRFTDKTDGIKLSCIQFAVAAVISAVLALIFERQYFSWDAVLDCWLPLVYSGIGSSGIAFTLQIIGQKDTNPTAASLVMSLESCFSVLGGYVVLHQVLTTREWIGCALMFVAVILTETQDLFAKKKK